MKTTILLFHPHMDQSRVNKALAKAAVAAGFEVRDMYDLYPDFRIDVAKERQILEKTDRIVFQFPVYWYSSPALVKQYEDAVFTGNWAYNGGQALLNHEWLLAVSPGADQDAYTKDGRVHFTMPDLLHPYQATSILIKTKFMTPFISYNASNMSDEELNLRAQQYVQYLQQPDLKVADRYGLSEA
ncbi:NAD(P)H-dependent oxidoreductase [uncultured Limosilactobacillus sp.]|uniref:NAD(P)H-dependent oxidoreductase n=1 Tax=uncultured Limosilactobacillus sp. TaxID=2837629 RepID=UPI0025D5CF5E|nr:NAD(P)H-dependent oxidoreductase [uncultured Limosilactobacillus sp.]